MANPYHLIHPIQPFSHESSNIIPNSSFHFPPPNQFMAMATQASLFSATAVTPKSANPHPTSQLKPKPNAPSAPWPMRPPPRRLKLLRDSHHPIADIRRQHGRAAPEGAGGGVLREHMGVPEGAGVRDAIMRQGPNLLKLARKEQCLALGTRLRSKYKINYQFYRVCSICTPGEGQRRPDRSWRNFRSIGKNVSPIEVKFSGKQVYDL